jgi:hypothetical protein
MEVMTFAKEIIITAFVGHLGPLELSSLVLAQVIPRVCLLPLDITIYLQTWNFGIGLLHWP